MLRNYLDYEGLELYNQLIKETYAPIQAIQYKGTVATISDLPTVANVPQGWMYGVTEGGVMGASFIENGGILRNNSNVVAVNTGTDDNPVMKWDLLAGVFSVDDKLTFGTSMPASPEDTDTFLYLGTTTYEYNAVSDTTDKNPKAEGWYEYDTTNDEYNLSTDEEAQVGTSYFTKDEEYVKGVIYVYSAASSSWIAQSSGDDFQPIPEQAIRNLFN